MTAFHSRWQDWEPKEPTLRTDKTDKRAFVSSVGSPPRPFTTESATTFTRCSRSTAASLDSPQKGTRDNSHKTPIRATDKTDKSPLPSLDGVPEVWTEGVVRLLAMPPHSTWEPERWRVLQDDVYGFLLTWGAQAHLLGWMELDLFAVHRTHPWARLDSMGLVPLLGGRSIVAMTETEAAIKTGSGGTLTYYRRKPPYPSEVCLIWEL